jgi:hypothetical protein
VRIAGTWMYLFRAVDSYGQTVDFFLSASRDREAAKTFLKRALSSWPERFCGAHLRRTGPRLPERQTCEPPGRSGRHAKTFITCGSPI